MRLGFCAFAAFTFVIAAVTAEALDLGLPTDNDAIFRGGGAEFYQYIERDYKGAKSTPWEGGQYGFVRNPVETAAGIFYTRFHEGIDIKPMQRDANGEPIDEVRAISAGKVVYVNTVAGYSNYGRYIVVEHRWDGAPYYSLYGHLSSPLARVGQSVQRGEKIAVMGYTGEGLNRERAHLHLEINLLLSHNFEAWHDTVYRNDPNHHGVYNGLNLQGIDVPKLYLANRENSALTISQFLANEETFYKVALPNARHFELPARYPWMVKSANTPRRAWEVSFARSGVPLKIEPIDRPVSQPELTYVKRTEVDCSYYTRGEIAGRGASAHLTESGKAQMRLLIWPD